LGDGVIAWAVRRPVTVTVGVILVLLFGGLSVVGIPIQLTPDVTIPSVSVTTRWPGATPTEVEADILEAQEEALKGLLGLERMTARATRGEAEVDLELAVGTPLDVALVRVSNLLSQVDEYPQTARQPAVDTANSSGPPLAVIIVHSDPPGRNIDRYRTYFDQFVLPRFDRIPGVASARLVGGREEELHVDFDPQALAARGIPVSQIAARIKEELRDISGGDISMGKRQYVVRTEVMPDTPEELERTVLSVDADGTPVLLGDVAQVSMGLRKPDAATMSDGHPSLALLLYREAGTNVLEVTEEIHRVVDEAQRELLAPEGLQMRVVSDQTGYIYAALDLVEQNLLLGGALAVVVLLLFLRSLSASMVVALSIPISVVGTALGMSLMGRTINIVSLAGMAFAVGMVVDNSIVVLENIDNWRARESNTARAALMGAKEVWGAILASTLTTAAVFIPIIGWQDEVGELLRDVAIAVSTAVFVSLVVSVLVIPSFSAVLLRGKKTKRDTGPSRVVRGVGRAVGYLIRSPARALTTSLVALLGLGALGWALVPPMEYLPTGNRNIVFGVVTPPPGYSVQEMKRIGEHVQNKLVPHTGKEVDGKVALARSFFVARTDSAFMGAVSADETRVPEAAALLREAVADVPDVRAFVNQGSLFGRSLGGGRSIEIDIMGERLPGMIQFGTRMRKALMEALPGAQIRENPSLDLGAPEFRITPRRAQASQLGISSSELGLIVDSYVDGAIIGELGPAGQIKRDVVMRAHGVEVDDVQELQAAPVATPSGHTVPLREVGELGEQLGPTVVRRIERRRAITLQLSPPADVALETALSRVRAVTNELREAGEMPDDVRVAYAGTAGKLDESKERLAEVLLLAVLISYLLLAALFENFIAPIAILTTVPLAGAGGILGLRLVDRFLGAQPLDMMTSLGFVILIGVVVNNAILIVDGSLSRMREEGLELREAIVSAVQWRVRPILMSALTSLAGLLPLVLFPGSGSELYRGVGGVVLGGLALSTALSLFVVPTVFSLVWRVRRAATTEATE
jgi:HAE1 family hydrophobic/amphiphilic exporter-1